MIVSEEYYEDVINNLLDALVVTAGDVVVRGQENEIEEFIDQVSHTIIEFGGEWDDNDA